MAPLSFRGRLTLRWTLVFSCLLAAASVAIYVGIRTASYADLDRHLRTLAGTEVASAFDQPVSPHVHELPVSGLGGSAFVEKVVQVFDASGRLVVSSRGRAENPRLIPQSVVADSLHGETPVVTITDGGVPIRVVALRKAHDGIDYVFVVGVVISELVNNMARVRWLLVVVWVLSTAATAAVGFALASTALRPVRRITERALHIAKTDIRARLEPPNVDDEIGAMGRSLNTLLERLHAALDANRRFAADAAHELRSPITAMAGEIDVALRRERTAAEYRETLELVRERLSSLSAIIRDLMLLVYTQEGRETIVRQELSLEALVNTSVARLAAAAALRGITVSVRNLAGLWTYGDASILGRVFDNVIENAIRYNRDGGTVTIDARFTDAPADSWNPAVITVRITDEGPGIPPGELHRIFERFYRVDTSRNRHTGGAGLGLAIAREVLAVFHGTIHVEQTSPRGTTMAIRLPGRQDQPIEPSGVPSRESPVAETADAAVQAHLPLA
jgi:signal transduction histidine kinase